MAKNSPIIIRGNLILRNNQSKRYTWELKGKLAKNQYAKNKKHFNLIKNKSKEEFVKVVEPQNPLENNPLFFPPSINSQQILDAHHLQLYLETTQPSTSPKLKKFTNTFHGYPILVSDFSNLPNDCCNSLKTLMSSGKDCLCLIATGSVPFNMPINRTLAISLPRACNMPSVPLQCKASGAPVPAPAPGPTAFGPTMSPKSAPSPTSQAPTSTEPVSPPLSPEADATPTPPSATTGTGAPTSDTGNRAGVTPSAAHPSLSASPLLLLAVLVVFALKYY
ncbi:unnamed protein product [Fraxinus pennsylvanica]|uniref:Bifunctional inhibitor/plant lipid transfer protein/seed storage helical domain-containing protein n=1 Tax=Fraxinus pennsylvanica TaxID=56036 RepID=A0AAD1ZU48_9LAMI|nr:unnamed protein product [Fraxinus pennsylvanica]